jgi:general secretion pathway protein G
MHKRRMSGFTLVELVVVILVLGILAAVAAPKLFDTAGDARNNGTKQSLAVVRDAIELYRAQEGAYPAAAATLDTALKDYLRGPFPSPEVGANKGNTQVEESAENPIATVEGEAKGWIYNPATGEFRINSDDLVGGTSVLTW